MASSASASCEVLHAPERCVDVRVPRPEPVTERGTQQLTRRRRRGPLHHEVIAVEEIGRVLRVGGHRAEPWKSAEERARPLPSIANQVPDAPGAAPIGMTAGGRGIPGLKIEHTM